MTPEEIRAAWLAQIDAEEQRNAEEPPEILPF